MTTRRRQRVVDLCGKLPDARVETAGTRHLAFKVNGKAFGYYCHDHHGDGVIAVWCKAPPGEQARLRAERPAVYFAPAYVGARGWIGIRLDTPRVDWAALKDHLFAAWLMTAPASARKRVQAADGTDGARERRRRTKA
jgi:hypothetical protein